MNVQSKFDFFGGYGLILLLVVFAELCLGVFINLDGFESITDKNNDLFPLSWIVIIGQLWIHSWLVVNSNRITINKSGIEFKNVIFPFYKRMFSWNELDFYILVDEKTRVGINETIWLIKDNRLTRRIPSFYYLNYVELEKNIQLDRGKTIKLDYLQQLWCVLGGSIRSVE